MLDDGAPEEADRTPERPTPPARSPWSARERWLALRDRLLAAPWFQRWAAAFPLTRPLARRRARALFDLCAGFVYSQVLFACVRLRVFDLLAGGPISLEAFGRRTDLPADAAKRLVDAAASLDLLTKLPGDRVALGELGAALRGAPGVAEMVEHHALLYADLADPVALLRDETRSTALGAYWTYATDAAPGALSAERTHSYSELMAASQPFVAEETLDAYPVGRHRRLLDIGGGHGGFARAAAGRAPGLDVTVFDLPPVAAEANRRFAAAGLSDRVRAVGGSFFDDPLPAGADLVTLVRVLYDHDDSRVLAILRAARRAAAPGGVIVIAEPMSETPGAGPIGDAYYGFYLLAMRGGRPRTPAEISALLSAAGFESPRLLPTRRPLLTRVVTARVGEGASEASSA